MKKSTLESIRNYLNGDTSVDLDTLREEVNDEYNRLTAKARANADMYATAATFVLPVLSTEVGMTAKEIHAACSADLPEEFSVNKVQYLLLHQLADRVVKHDNGKNANTYTLKG